MRRLTIPTVLRELGEDPRDLRILLVAALSMAAAGLNPWVASPALVDVQSSIRAQPEVAVVVLLLTVVAAATLFVGGILGDADGRRGILLGALAVLTVTGLTGLLVPSGPVFIASRLAGGGAAYLVIPFAMALVATTYRGVVRATAIGIVSAAYGAAVAAGPVLLTVLDSGATTWPAFLAGTIGAALALWFAWPRAPDLPAPARTQRSYVVATACWAFAVVIITAGIAGLGSDLARPLRYGLIGLGVALLIGYIAWDRRRRRGGVATIRVDRRPVTVAVAVGVIIGLAQAAPLFQLPIFFRVILGYGPLGATIATAPFIVALVISGPLAGVMLRRFAPRVLIAGGLLIVGLGNLFAGAVLGDGTWYLALVLPLFLIGFGFVVATTVRTAVIFASVSRGLTASAAALNEASILVGSRIGLTLLTAVITQGALDRYAGTLVGLDGAEQAAAVEAFRRLMTLIGTPELGTAASLVDQAAMSAYVAAFVGAYQQSLLATGMLAVVAAPIVWLSLGRQDPLTTVWDHAEERVDLPAPTTG